MDDDAWGAGEAGLNQVLKRGLAENAETLPSVLKATIRRAIFKVMLVLFLTLYISYSQRQVSAEAELVCWCAAFIDIIFVAAVSCKAHQVQEKGCKG